MDGRFPSLPNVVCVGDEAFPNWRLPEAGSVAILGVFDGLHLGHQRVLSTGVELARRRGLPALAFTFANHPQSIIDPTRVPRLLTTPHRRLALMARLGLDYLVSPSFTRDFADLDARQFIRSILLERFKCRAVVVGFNYHFGHKRQGTPDRLREVMAEYGGQTIVVEPMVLAGEPVSSTRVRQAIADADLPLAATLLGRLHQVEGVVVPGTGRARGLGYPTANLLVEASLLLPPVGVYAGRAMLGEQGPWHPALIYHGSRPMERELDPELDTSLLPHLVEVHLLDGTHELADRMLQVGLGPRLRGEMRFADLADLKRQLARDRQAAADWQP